MCRGVCPQIAVAEHLLEPVHDDRPPAMSEKLKVGDRVRIRTSQKIYVVSEVDPSGGTPIPPATQIVLLTPEDGKGPEQRYGNAVLVKVT